MPVLHDDAGGLALDTILLDQQSIDILFSLSRAYFLVDMDVPSDYVHFLQTIMPTRPRSELYTALGLAGQGKTLFFRDLRHHLHHSRDLFVEAAGTRGLVMHVFNLPSYPYVFKVIRDRFGSSKNTDRATVDVEVPARARGRPRRPHGAHHRVHEPRAAARPLRAGAARAARRARAVGDRARRRQPDRQALLRRAPADAAQPLLRDGLGRADRARGARVRRHDPRARDRERLPRRSHLAQLRPDALRPRALLRLRRGRVPHGLRVPRDSAAADARGRAVGGRLVRASGRATCSRRSSGRSCSATTACASRFCATTPTCLSPEFWRESQRRIAVREIVDFFPYSEDVRFCRRYARV